MKIAQHIFFFLFFVSSLTSSAFTLDLNETDIGKAIVNEDIEAYRKAWDALKRLPYWKASEILTATDPKGNNILHLMAQVKKSQEAFAGEMLQLSIILIDDFDNHDMFEALNKQELSPEEVAMQEENSRAVEYLTTASNRVKKMRNAPSGTVERTGESKKFSKISVPVKYGAAGALLTLNGLTLLRMGLSFQNADVTFSGISSIGAGGWMCYEAFNMIKKINRSKDM